MNNYLLLLGSNMTEIRKILNITQEELAKRMGVSRPTIVKIEQDPSKFTKTLAFAFFMVISYEINTRIDNVKQLDPTKYKNSDQIKMFTDEIKKSSLLSIGKISTAATFGLGGLIPGVGALITNAGSAGFLKAAEKKLTENIKWDEEKAEKILEAVQKKLFEDYRRIVEGFQLSDLKIEQFVEKVEDGELTIEM